MKLPIMHTSCHTAIKYKMRKAFIVDMYVWSCLNIKLTFPKSHIGQFANIFCSFSNSLNFKNQHSFFLTISEFLDRDQQQQMSRNFIHESCQFNHLPELISQTKTLLQPANNNQPTTLDY